MIVAGYEVALLFFLCAKILHLLILYEEERFPYD